MREARAKQSAMYAITAAEESCGLISSSLPSLLLKVMLNQLTRRYSLSLTHVNGDVPVEGVDAMMYWRPPQGNCSKLLLFNMFCAKVKHLFLLSTAYRKSFRIYAYSRRFHFLLYLFYVNRVSKIISNFF